MKLGTAFFQPGTHGGVRMVLGSDLLKKGDGNGLVLEEEALGRLKRELFWTVGESRAFGLLARFGYSCGQADLLNPTAAAGLIRGLGEIKSLESDDELQEYVVDIHDSCEALEYQRFFQGKSKMPQCWLLAGYLSGIISGTTGLPIYFLETKCVARQDSCCRFVGKRKANWAPDQESALSVYEEDNLALELSEACEQLKLTKDRYQNLFEQANVPIFIMDPDTSVFVDANIAAEELTGFSRDQLLTMNSFDLTQARDHQLVIDHMRKLAQDGKVPAQELTIVRKDGTIRIIIQSSKIMSFGGKRVIQTVMRDVTDLKLSEQKERDLQSQLVRSERLSSIGRLAASVAHELKNPLGAIRNAIYYIRNALAQNPILETDPHLLEILKLSENEVDSSVTIIGELLDFSRVVNLVPRRTMVNDLLEQLPSIVVIPDNIQLAWDLDPNLPAATVDSDRLRQVFCNIVNNAVQAMPQGGTLTVRTRTLVESGADQTSTPMFTVSFEDTGTGIAPWHLAKIFEPLFTTKTRGTGLGLAISNNIVEKHGGAILVSSQTGKGTVFTVKLPQHVPVDKEDQNHASG